MADRARATITRAVTSVRARTDVTLQQLAEHLQAAEARAGS
jgi:hypothetical protein